MRRRVTGTGSDVIKKVYDSIVIISLKIVILMTIYCLNGY